jgi:hypothetical protein
VLGPNHSEVAASLNNLVLLYGKQGRYSEAIPLARRALTIDGEALGPGRPEVASWLNDLAELYRAKVATPMPNLSCKRSLAIREKVLGPDLAYRRDGRLEQRLPDLVETAHLTFKGTVQPRPAYCRDQARRFRAGSLLGQLRGRAEGAGSSNSCKYSRSFLARRRANSRFGSSAVSDLLGT